MARARVASAALATSSRMAISGRRPYRSTPPRFAISSVAPPTRRLASTGFQPSVRMYRASRSGESAPATDRTANRGRPRSAHSASTWRSCSLTPWIVSQASHQAAASSQPNGRVAVYSSRSALTRGRVSRSWKYQ